MKFKQYSSRFIQSAVLMVGMAVWPCLGNTLFWGGGTNDIVDGTALSHDNAELSGTWDDTTKNWASDSSGTTYVPYADGAFIQWGWFTNTTSASIVLATNITFSGMSGCMNAVPSGYSQSFSIDSSGSSTLTPVGNPCILNPISGDTTRGITIRRPLSGDAPILKTGYGYMTLAADSDGYTGTLTVSENALNTGTAKFRGITNAVLSGRVSLPANSTYGANTFSYGDWRMGAQDSVADLISDNLRVVLNNGSFTYSTRSKTFETMGSVDVETWGSIGASGSTASNLGGVLVLSNSVAGITRGSRGIGVLQFSATYGLTGIQTAIRVPNGLPTDTLIPWIYSARSECMYVDSANENTLMPLIPEYADTDLSQWTTLYGANSNVRVGSNDTVTLSGLIADDLTISSLAFLNRGKATVAMADGKTLCLASGVILQRAIASGSLQTVSNGYLTASTDKLYINTQNTNAGGDLYLYSAITGRFDVVTTGKGAAIQFRGPAANAYSGTTYVSFGTLFLNKTGGAIAIPGPLVVRFGGAVNATGYDNQIADTADVTIEESGVLACRAQTFGGTVTLTGGTLLLYNYTDVFNKSGTGLVFNGGWIGHRSSSDGTFVLQTDVGYEASSTTQAKFERYNTGKLKVQLTGGDRMFDVADSSTLADGVPEMVVDTPITSASGESNGLIKTGDGILQLTYTNTYAGATTVNGGTLKVSKIQAEAKSGLTAYTCGLTGTVTFPEPVAKDMVLGQWITGAKINSGGTRVLRVLNDYEVQTYDGNSTGISEDAAVDAVERGGTLGLDTATVNNTGTLQIDAGIALDNDVVVNAGGTLDASGAGIGTLTVDGGAVKVDLASAPMVVASTIDLTDAVLDVVGEPTETPVPVISYSGALTGRFATVPENVSVLYFADEILVGRRSYSLIVVR